MIGIYHLTDDQGISDDVKGVFNTIDQVISHYKSDELHLRDRVKLRVGDEHIETTVGRVVYNAILPEKVRFVNETVGKKGLKKILDRIFDAYGREEMVRTADALKDKGFKYATLSAVTMNIFDLHLPEEKEEILSAA